MIDSTEHDRTRLAAYLQTICAVDDAQKALLSQLPLRILAVDAGTELQGDGRRSTEACLVLSGMLCRSKIVSRGKRQIVSLHWPGDLLDLEGIYLEQADNSINTITSSRVGFIPHSAIRQIMRNMPTSLFCSYG